VTQNLRNYIKALYGFDAVIQRVPESTWDFDSPCDGWCAGEVVAHACGVMDAVAEMARTGEVAMPGMPDPGDSPVELWNTSRDGLFEALDQPHVINRVGKYWFGASTIDDLLGFVVWDPLGHAWDLGRAVGLDPHLNADVAEASIVVIGQNADMLRSMKLMADPVEVGADADAPTRFLGLIGRDPAR
jgi:uncharacterized protein (TIGR03086 family)